MRTHHDLQKMASFISTRGRIHTGDQFAAHGPMDIFDICAIAYLVAEDRPAPDVFFTDELASIALIEASPRAMAAIKAISDVLDSTVCETRQPDGTYAPDYIEHVSNWAATASPVDPKRPPTLSEVIGRILRAANHAATQATGVRPGHADAWGLCLTCHGHGSVTVDGEEIPYAELSPRRKQGHRLGHRFYRNTSKTCPHCDGQDRVTDAAVSAHEASL